LLPELLSVLGSIFVTESRVIYFVPATGTCSGHLRFDRGRKQWPGLEFGEMEERSPKGSGLDGNWTEEHGEPLRPDVCDFANLP
jgi:hypothetical protein